MAGTFTAKPLGQVSLTASEADVYTVPASTVARVTQIIFCNTDTSDRTVRLWAIPSGGASGVANALFYDFVIPAKRTIAFDCNFYLSAAAKLRGLASVTSVVSCQAFGIEES